MLAEPRKYIVATHSYHKSVGAEARRLAGFILTDVVVRLCAIGRFGEAGEEMQMLRFFAGVFALLVACVCWADENPPLLLHQPTISATQVVFVYAGDLWSVPRAGGVAQRLTAGAGTASRPVFSPDGSEIAFTGNYDGNADVYLIPASGGTPRRLTYHPAADEVVGWTRDGKSVLFASERNSYSFFNRLFTFSREGVFPTTLAL